MTEKLLGAVFALIAISLATLLAHLNVVSGDDWIDLAKTSVWAITLGIPLLPVATSIKNASAAALERAKHGRE
jgi:hypothetical protein